ncbi:MULTISPECIES: type II secretion system protein GspM [Pseudomonas]|uniref:Type II secretion system protein M n=1 Tax=Pseudomonas peradeniyensis TaxID=2745488 RepID=A0ABT2VCS0_9PSED|nr:MULTISPECIES: type II secretion system protein GspM [Pseudomonas]MCU7239529.1 type II secretion system protein M [Pseudomonas peradeniyensis]MCU7280842.1 type II secretion system protein M [Pseudomonas peradeniyensis]QZA56474.1 type II secretion system protein M [Pseudomonas sp. 2hn]
MSIKARLANLRVQGRQRWQALAVRERRAVALGAGLLGVLLCWQVLVQPALARIDHWQAEIPKLRGQAQALDALLGERLAQRPADIAQAVRQSLEQAGLQAHSQLDADGDAWRLSWQRAPAEAAMAWLQGVPPRLGLGIGQLALRRDPDTEPGSPVTFSGTLRMDQAHGAKDPS